uniref:Coiled-coil and C2 domain-containing protein 1B n=1 Tax=Oncorhynchus kisutch TaxID=8019 RepID=A0A8C7L5R2_ONCKI
MADIERMAALCMKDLDEDDDDGDDDLEDDDDLLAELNEVLEDDDDEEVQKPATTPSSNSTPCSTPSTPSGATGLEACLAERINMYQTAISNANAEGETSKARRYDRGLKVSQRPWAGCMMMLRLLPSLLSPASWSPLRNTLPLPRIHLLSPPSPLFNQTPLSTGTFWLLYHSLSPSSLSLFPSLSVELKQCVLNRQREYKLAALHAKQGGESELARQHYHIAKKLDPVVEALDRGEPVDLSSLPPPPGALGLSMTPYSLYSALLLTRTALPAPGNVGEALQQRMDRYKAAAEGAKSKGDDRKARMHQRIVKQYQDAIRSHKAGRPVNLADLPVPPGCPPLQGSESSQQNFMGVLETAMKLANQDADAEDEDGTGELAKPAVGAPVQKGKAPTPLTPGSGGNTTQAQQQLDFLLLRRQAFIRAALRSKQMKDMQGAAVHLRHAKGLDQMISATKGGLPVDITKVEAFTLHILVFQHEEDCGMCFSLQKCLGYSQQFTHMGSVAETSRFEKLAEECMQNIEVLKMAHAKGQPVPKYHTEERTFNTVKMYPDLTANEMTLYIVKGINLPAPSGVSASDLDTSVRFEFPFPSMEEAQRDKTSTVKNSNSPEFKEKFNLNINRQHRGFKRVVQAKGIKFDIIHKGGLFKGDKVLGNAQLKLDSLENQCDIRQIIEVLDGRKATGGKLEVRVKIREPLGGAQLQITTEKWLVLDPVPITTPDREREQQVRRERDGWSSTLNHSPPPTERENNSHSPPQYKLHSFSLLHYDKERLERQIGDYRKSRRDPPSDLVQQHKEVTHRLQWQKAQLERGSPTLLSEYENILQRFAQGLAESVKRFSSQGNRVSKGSGLCVCVPACLSVLSVCNVSVPLPIQDAAKDALGRLKMVETEVNTVIYRQC